MIVIIIFNIYYCYYFFIGIVITVVKSLHDKTRAIMLSIENCFFGLLHSNNNILPS